MTICKDAREFGTAYGSIARLKQRVEMRHEKNRRSLA